MQNKYDLIFVGFGPATMFGVLELINKGYKKDILIIEKGKFIEDREKTDVINGVGGSGLFSDSKLSSALDVGGTIPGLTQSQLEKYESLILKNINKFKKLTDDKKALCWDTTQDFDVSKTSLEWNKHKTCHVGTDNGHKIYYEIEKFIKSQPNINILTETEVKDILYKNRLYSIFTDKEAFASEKLILATGQKNTLPSKIINQFKLPSTFRSFQLGIRVVDELNPQYEDIIKANYDFKFVKNYQYDNIKIRVRTFCCNSGNAHVCAEKANEGFTCFNGHAYKNPDPNNNSVNYGIMCEIDGLDGYSSKESQIELMKKINKIDTWYDDNFYNDDKLEEDLVLPKRKLLDGFDFLKGYYPQEAIESLTDFISELNKIVDLSKAHFLYPEVKLSGEIPNLNYKTFETKLKNLYMIGDCAISRGIVKSSLTGIILADNLMEEENAIRNI